MKRHINPHDHAVYEFMKSCQERDPNSYAEVCEKYPTISARQWRRIRERELGYNEIVEERLYGTSDDDSE